MILKITIEINSTTFQLFSIIFTNKYLPFSKCGSQSSARINLLSSIEIKISYSMRVSPINMIKLFIL